MVLLPLVVGTVVVGVDLWVLADARRWSRLGTPVVFRVGSLSVETAEAWAVLCLVLFAFFVPIYAVARRAS